MTIAAAYRRRGLNAGDAVARLAQLEQKLADYEEELRTLQESNRDP
jgi:hypothetical protein